VHTTEQVAYKKLFCALFIDILTLLRLHALTNKKPPCFLVLALFAKSCSKEFVPQNHTS